VAGGQAELEETYPGRSHSPVWYHVPEAVGKQNNTGRPWEPLAGRGHRGRGAPSIRGDREFALPLTRPISAIQAVARAALRSI